MRSISAASKSIDNRYSATSRLMFSRDWSRRPSMAASVFVVMVGQGIETLCFHQRSTAAEEEIPPALVTAESFRAAEAVFDGLKRSLPAHGPHTGKFRGRFSK